MSPRAPLAVMLMAGVAAAALVTWPAASAAQVAEPTQPAGPTVELVEQTTWVSPSEVFHMRVDVDRLPPGGSISLDVHPHLGSRNEFTETLANGVSGPPDATPFSQTAGELNLEPDGTLALSFIPGDAGLTEPGVYPVQVRVTDGSGQEVTGFLSHMLLLPPAMSDFTPLTVATIFEVGTSSPGLQPDGTTDVTSDELAQINARIEALEQIEGPVSVAPVPETLDTLARLNERGPDEASGVGANQDQGTPETTERTGADASLIDELGATLRGNEVLARPYVDLDLETWAAANLVTEAPREANAGAQTVRSHYGLEPTPGIWLTGPTVGRNEAATWSNLGVSKTIVSSSAIADVPGSDDSVAPLVQLPDGPVGFVSDHALVERLSSVQRPLDVYHFVSELAMIWFEWPARSRAVVLRIPEQAPINPTLVAQALNQMTQDQAVNLATATELFARHGPTDERQPVPVELAPKQATDDLSWMSAALNSATQTLTGLEGAIDDRPLMASLERAILIAPGARTPSQDRRRHLDRVESSAAEIADGVNAPETFRITLTAREGSIPLTINNDLGEPVSVRVHLTSNQLEFLDGSEFDLVVPPEGVREDLRVRTRTSGAFPLHISLTSPDGNVVVDETTFNVRSTTFSGVGLALSVGAGLFLIVWWTRNWRRTRRRRPAEHG